MTINNLTEGPTINIQRRRYNKEPTFVWVRGILGVSPLVLNHDGRRVVTGQHLRFRWQLSVFSHLVDTTDDIAYSGLQLHLIRCYVDTSNKVPLTNERSVPRSTAAAETTLCFQFVIGASIGPSVSYGSVQSL